MNTYRRIVVVIQTIVLSVSTNAFVSAQPTGLPDLVVNWADSIYLNGNIVTLDDPGINISPGTIVEAMAVRDGKILALGNSSEISTLAGPDTLRVDLQQRTLIPGLIDNHFHLHQAAWRVSGPKVLPNQYLIIPAETTVSDFPETALSFIEEAVEKTTPGKWIFVQASYQQRGIIAEAVRRGLVTKAVLDEIAPNNPVLIEGRPGILVNDAAIDWLDTWYKEPIDLGLIRYDRETGDVGPVTTTRRSIVAQGVFGNPRDMAALIESVQKDFVAYGTTSFTTHARQRSILDAYVILEREGRLIPRVGYALGTPTYLNPYGPRYVQRMNTTQGLGSDKLWNAGIETEISDSSCSILQGNADVEFREGCHEKGTVAFETTKVAAANGMRLTGQHVAGDRGVDLVVQAIVEGSHMAGMSDEEIRAIGHAVDHCSLYPRPDQIEKLKRYGIRLNCSVDKAWQELYERNNVVDRYGPEAEQKFHQWAAAAKTALDNGMKIGMHGPDVRILPYFPFIASFVTREFTRDWVISDGEWDWNFTAEGDSVAPDQAIDRVLALKMATVWNADNILRGDELGSLEPGKFADFIVLDRDYFTINEHDIKRIEVLMTVIDGTIEHQSDKF
ncbi:MAG: putative amidohydrolase YtcJ [Gammaproteobacteria bacterium]|jgi:predicted amidohydrolase YtcJ